MWELKEETFEVFKGKDHHLRFKEPLNVMYDDECYKSLMLLNIHLTKNFFSFHAHWK